MIKSKKNEQILTTRLTMEEEYPFSYLYEPVDTTIIEEYIKNYEKEHNINKKKDEKKEL